MWSDDKTETQSSAGLPSYSTSVRTRSARAVYRRVRKVVWLQWRGITIVVFILVDVIFFSVVFVYLNSVTTHAVDDIEKALPFLACLIGSPTKPEKCTELGQALFVDLHTVIAVLMMLSVSAEMEYPGMSLQNAQLAGIQAFFLLARSSMFTGWRDFFSSKFGSNREFVSLDAKQPPEFTPNARQFELTKFAQMPVASPPSAVTSPYFDKDEEPHRRSLSGTPDHFAKETQRNYTTPTLSFSVPRPPSAARGEWDPRSTHARGGLGLHPPMFEEDEPRDNRI